MVMGAERVSYGELLGRAVALRAGMAERGLEPGDRVAVMSRHAVDFVALYFATAASGITMVPLSYWHREGEQREVLAIARPDLVVCEREFEAQVAGLAAEVGAPVVVVEDGRHGDDEVSPPWTALYGEVPAGADPDARPLVAGHPHMMIFTSGTTGTPKGALLSEARTVESAYGMSLALGLRRDDVYIDCFRTFHSGSWDHLKLYFLVGASIVLIRDFDAAVVVEKIQRERVTVVLAGGTMLRLFMDSAPFAGADLSSLRLVYAGAYADGTGLADEFMGRLREHNPEVAFAATYGLTEFGPYVTLMTPDEVALNPAAVGRPIPGVRVELVDDDGNLVPRGTAGEVVAFGPSFDGYLDRPEETAESRLAGGLRTGDIAIEDEHGFLVLVDRKKDIVRSGAHNIFSAQVETGLAGHEAVAEVAVVGVPDPVLVETVCAVVVLAGAFADADPSEVASSIQERVRSQLAGYNVPKFVVAVDALPRNSNGKVLKRELREALRDLATTGEPDVAAVKPRWISRGEHDD
ncbi:long-chain fatty acid--CoA ligase [Nocardioides marmoriginsengisoli]|uniref:Long-chain fatty acid--CoA ligase n=1 Tax=Nocardioides marmoriginsengisoli TaxID=661483 RepID=A0A3N0CGV3_9ACTN|nr:long-chain fatty acid--CoA ligase [Nocardioides marmoriginsengisoli]